MRIPNLCVDILDGSTYSCEMISNGTIIVGSVYLCLK